MNNKLHTDPAEQETLERRKRALTSTFDSLVESNLQLVKTVRSAIIVITTCALLSMVWGAWTTYSMRGTQLEMRAMLHTVLVTVTHDDVPVAPPVSVP